MKIMLVIGDKSGDAVLEMVRQLGIGNMHYYVYKEGKFLNSVDFENDQKYFDCIYSPDPDILLKLKLKIPYFYDIPSGRFNHELNYRVFDKHYSQLGGAKAVFVNDKKMSRYAHWAGLNPHWVNDGIDFENFSFSPKKFIMNKLNIGYIYDNEDNYKIIKDVFSAKKPNWVFHLYKAYDLKQDGNIKFYNGDLNMTKKVIFDNCHIMLNPSTPCNHSITPVPSKVSLEAMLSGCISVSGNMHNNMDHVIFDKFHYLKLDFIDANTIIETLRYADKRREKLDRMSKAGRDLVLKYYDAKESAKRKLNIIKSLI